VDTTLLTVKGNKSYTGRCVCLVDQKGQRTMRPALEDAIRLQPDEISPDCLKGVKWVIVNGYSYYGPGLVECSVEAANKAGCKVAMHLASFEVVRRFRKPLVGLYKCMCGTTKLFCYQIQVEFSLPIA
jgi:sugar/nucleoside kinase (ribokinase family)